MITLFKQHKLVIIFGVVFAAIAIWYGLSSSGPPPATITTTSSAGVVDPSLVQTLLTVSSIDLSGTLFTEQAFSSLRDFSTQIIQEPVGRPNPFAPLVSTAAPSVASSTRAARVFAPATGALVAPKSKK